MRLSTGPLIVEQIRAGGDRNFCYLVACGQTGAAAAIDPSYGAAALLRRARELGLSLDCVFNTHGHSDHTTGNAELLSSGSATLIGFGASPPALAAHDGDLFRLGERELRVIHTPGHTPDSICILADARFLFTGDTLFVGKVGGTGLGPDARQEYDSIHDRLMRLPDGVVVCPGHDYGVRPVSTIGEERAGNPFVLRDSFESFIELKRNWQSYKREHGIR
ncbi:MBL fold metallo-hydrolase [Candidatus Fermentibacterales bacterium]|nr:MBL fold metallo-hydrolase [Candidatus Fermentibacterales bacterium]